MYKRTLAVLMAATVLCAPAIAEAQSANAGLHGRVLDARGGLPVQNATIELDKNGQAIATTKTDANGVYTFPKEPQGEFSVLIVAPGYVSTRVPQVFLLNGSSTELQTAIEPTSGNESTNLKEIGNVVVVGNQTLQTTTTINSYIDPAQMQALGYSQPAFLLTRVPGVDTHTSPSTGDDMSVSIRGYDPSETATLLDGHPIGPIGAYGGANSPGFDYKLAPFWGLSGTNVIFGSGAAGMYGVSTIAGAVDFDTINPTRQMQASFTQGVGNSDHTMSGFTATGTIGKLGYAFAGAVQGSTGNFPGGDITQTANMSASAYCNSGPKAPTCTDASGNPFAPPDLTAENAALNSYNVTGAYTQRNAFAKLVYQFSPRTQLLTSFLDTTSWNDKTGNGDQDALSYQYVLNNDQGLLGQNFVLNGQMTNCSNTTIAVMNSSSQGYECLTAQQYAQNFSGPYGGGPGRWNASHMQDYHARLTQELGSTQLIVDGFVNNYNMDEHKSPVGPFFEDNYLTHGFLVQDSFEAGNHDLSFGYYTQHQRHDPATNFVGAAGSGSGPFYLTSDSFFVRDAWQNSEKLSTFLNLWEQHSIDTGAYNFDPRLSFVYHPTSNDVFRVTGGRSYSEPDPSLLSTATVSPSAPQSVNPLPLGQVTSIGTAGNPYLKPETAVDEEIAYGHRFSRRFTIQADAYSSLENNAILTATLPVSGFPQYNGLLNSIFPGSNLTWEQQYLNRIGPGATVADLGWTVYANAAQALYRGVNIDATINPIRNLTLDAQYGVQSAMYKGISDSILKNNIYLINDSQIAKIPLQKAFASLVYQNQAGFKAEFDETYIGNNNEYLQPAFWFADAAISKTTGKVTVTFGANNLFNNAATQYGWYGLGTFTPENQYGTDTSAIQQGGAAELYGLEPRQVFMTVSIKT
jgi:outer membrane receptor for ferrienterochelin and colicin